MKWESFVKKATVLTLSTAIFMGGSNLVHAEKKSPNDYKEDYGLSTITRSNMKNMIQQHGDKRFTVPTFDASTIQNIPSATRVLENGEKIKLDVWDTWPLQNSDGTVAEYNGYHILFGLAGNPDNAQDTFIYMFYKKSR